MKDLIVFDETFRIILDDVSEGKGAEFRASIYDSNNDLVIEGWGATRHEAIGDAFASEFGGQ